MDIISYLQAVDLSRFSKDAKSSEVFYGLSSDIKYYKRCVISNQRSNSVVEYNHTKNCKKETISFRLEVRNFAISERDSS